MIVAVNLTVHSIYTSPLFFGRLGGGIFNESNEAVPNNTALFTLFDGYYRLSFYCTTNYTHSRRSLMAESSLIAQSLGFDRRRDQSSISIIYPDLLPHLGSTLANTTVVQTTPLL